MNNNQIIYLLSSRHKSMKAASRQHNIPMEPDWNDFNEFVKDLYDGFVKLVETKPKRIFLQRIDTSRGYIRGNVKWGNTNVDVSKRHVKKYKLDGKYVTVKEICDRFGWKQTTATYFLNKYSVEAANEIINSDNPQRLIDDKRKKHVPEILYQGKIYTTVELVRFFKSKRIRLSKQLLSLRIHKKRKQLNLTRYDVIPMETQEIISNRNRTWILNKRLVDRILEEFQKEM